MPFNIELLMDVMQKLHNARGNTDVQVVLHNPDGTSLPLLVEIDKISIEGTGLRLHITDPY